MEDENEKDGLKRLDQEKVHSISFANNELEPVHVWVMETKRNLHEEAMADGDLAKVPIEMIEKALGAYKARAIFSEYMSIVVAKDVLGNPRIYRAGMVVNSDGTLSMHRMSFIDIEKAHGHMHDLDDIIMNTALNEVRLETDTDWKGTRMPSVRIDASSWNEVWDKLQEHGMSDIFLTLYKGTKAPEKQKAVSGTEVLIALDVKDEEKALIKKYGKARITKLKQEIDAKRKGIKK